MLTTWDASADATNEKTQLFRAGFCIWGKNPKIEKL